MEHSCAADSLRWKWPMVYDLIHSLALHLSNALRSSSQELRQSRTREEKTHVCLHYTTSGVAFWHALLPEDEPIAMYPPREHMKGVLKEAGYAALKVNHQVYHCFETDSMAAIHGGDIIADGEPEKLDRLDEALKQLVVVKLLDRVGLGAAEHGQYLKRHIVYINGQGFE